MQIKTTYGLKSKTVYIPSQAGKNKFSLQLNNELGLPHNSTIVAMQCRLHDDDTKGANGQTLVKAAVFSNSYLSLKDRECKSGKINLVLSQYHMPDLVAKTFFMEDIQSELIDWNNSFIEVNSRADADLVNNTFFEIVVYYTDDCNPPIQNRLCFRNGTYYAGKRSVYFEVPLNSVGTRFRLSDSPNIGIPKDAWIIGFSTKNNAFPLIAADFQSALSLKSTYFTLKHGVNAFIEDYPAAISDYKESLIEGIDYMPVTPIQSIKIDWQQSHILITENATVTNTMSFQFYLYWVRENELF